MGMSGTPTIVFRRTGELLLVSDEFLQLTGHSRADLLARLWMWTLMDVRDGRLSCSDSAAIVARHVLRGLRGACVRELAAGACRAVCASTKDCAGRADAPGANLDVV